ncbi:MAG: hypothetical protein RLZZ528_105 [Pseudomonadota bacterium]|jgi:hypothetical protein
MTISLPMRAGAALLLSLTLAGCGGGFGSGNLFGGGGTRAAQAPQTADERQSTIWDLFGNKNDPNTTVEVNSYLWQASLEVLNFLPIQSVDPFSGIIVTGFGTPPGGGGAYRATIYVQDPALDARSLKVALVSRAGPVAPDTVRAVEDAILTRARQLRVADGKL